MLNKLGVGMMALALFATADAHASPIVSGISCQGGELSVTTGAAFSAHCTGALLFDGSSVIQADESISLSSVDFMILWGTLIAPRIALTSNAGLIVSGGLFSGSPDYFPDVSAISHAGSANQVLLTFDDLVPHPVIHPVFGAVFVVLSSIQAGTVLVEPAPLFAVLEPTSFAVPGPASLAVPEPASLALLGIGLAGLGAMRRRKMG